MSRKFARLYTVSKTKWQSGQYINIYGKDDTLFSGGIYPTKIKIDDLPDWYVFGRVYKHWGYLSAKGSSIIRPLLAVEANVIAFSSRFCNNIIYKVAFISC